MALFSVTTFVVFHFGLQRDSVEGDARGRRAVGDAAVRRDARRQPAVRRRPRGGRLRRLPARAGRPHRAARRQGDGAVRASSRSSSSSPCRRSRCCCSGPAPATRSPALLARAAARRRRHRGDRDARRRRWRSRRARATCSSRCSALPLLHAGGHRAPPSATTPLLAGGGAGALPARWLRSSASMIWSSACSPTRSSTSCSRTERTSMYGKGLRTLSIATAVALTGGFALAVLLRADGRRPGLHAEDLLRPRADGDRRAVRLRRRRRSARSSTCARGDRALRPALLRRDPPVAGARRRRAGHRLDLGQGGAGATGGCGTSRRSSRS